MLGGITDEVELDLGPKGSILRRDRNFGILETPVEVEVVEAGLACK